VSSVSLEQATMSAEITGSQLSSSSCNPTQALDHLRDGSPGKTRGIAIRLIFESRIVARDPRNSSETMGVDLITQSTSSTLLQDLRRG